VPACVCAAVGEVIRGGKFPAVFLRVVQVREVFGVIISVVRKDVEAHSSV